jgi:hypothetical protein
LKGEEVIQLRITSSPLLFNGHPQKRSGIGLPEFHTSPVKVKKAYQFSFAQITGR